VEADIFSDGHGELAADLLWRAADEADQATGFVTRLNTRTVTSSDSR